MTTKAYLRRPYQRTFRGRLISQQRSGHYWEAILNRTLFYPTSGGQPHDTGTLAGFEVVEVIERDGEVVHRLANGPLPRLVSGEIDWERRFDHMQQHTGQHILSQAFEGLYGWPTVAFHLGRETVTIDLKTAPITFDQAYSVEDAANRIVYQDRPVHAYFVTEEASAGLDLRKLPSRHGTIRIVEVEQYDRIPCGGTHCRRTGEVGAIKILRHERRGGETRVEFVCGQRALHDYRWRNEALRSCAEALNAATREVPEFIRKVLADRDGANKQLEVIREQLLAYESEALAARATRTGGVDVVHAIFSERRPDEIKWLAQQVANLRPCLVLLATRTGGKGHLVFARSASLTVDAGALLKSAVAAVGGRGGGRSEAAQGGAPPDRLEEAIDIAIQAVKNGS